MEKNQPVATACLLQVCDTIKLVLSLFFCTALLVPCLSILYTYELSSGSSAKRNELFFFQKINLSVDQRISHVSAHVLCTLCTQARLHHSGWGSRGPPGAVLDSSATEGSTGPSPGDFVQVTRRCSQWILVHACYSSALRTSIPFSWQSQYFPHIDGQRFFRKIGPNEVLLPLWDGWGCCWLPLLHKGRGRRKGQSSDGGIEEGLLERWERFSCSRAASCLLPLGG